MKIGWFFCSCLCTVVLLHEYIFFFSIQITNHFTTFTDRLEASVLDYHSNDTGIYSVGGHPLTEGEHAPYVLGNETRFVGEDARFTCRCVLLGFNNSSPHENQAIWYKDGKFLKPDERHLMKWKLRVMPSNSTDILFYKVIATLYILLIEEEDFGNYTCHVSRRIISPMNITVTPVRPPNCRNRCNRVNSCDRTPMTKRPDITLEDIERMFFHYNQFEWVSEFRLLKEKPHTKKIFVAPGTLLNFGNHYRYMNFNATEKISMYYTVNGRPVTNNDTSCPTVVTSYHLVKHLKKGYIPAFPFDRSVKQGGFPIATKSKWWIWISLYSQCISPDTYGLHEFVILREVTGIDGTIQLREFDHPFKLDIKPKISDLFRVGNSTIKSPSFDVNCWNLEKSWSSFCDSLNFNVLQSADEVYWKDLLVIFCVVVLVIVVVYLVYLIQRWIYRLKIWLTRKLRVADEPRADSTDNSAPKPKYHVIVVNSDSDDVLVREKLVPWLRKFGLKFFILNQDILPGSWDLTAQAEAIHASQAYIIVAGNTSSSELEIQNFRFNSILLNVNNWNVMTIKMANCDVPNPFRRYSFMEFESLSEEKNPLMSWIDRHLLTSPAPLGWLTILWRLLINVLFLLYE